MVEEIKTNINLREIKSSYIIKGVFSFLYEKQKLKMIIYNKKLQKKLLVDLEDYKEISGKYFIGEKNGKGKEYNIYNDELIFEGEYLNAKRNGNGKEYYHDHQIKFEGEYLNGERNGKGKEYYYDGNLEFEGEYLNGERNGKGKEYNYNDKLVFEGEYLKGKRNGKVKEYHKLFISIPTEFITLTPTPQFRMQFYFKLFILKYNSSSNPP